MKKTDLDKSTPANLPKTERKEVIIFGTIVGGFFLMGTAAGGGGAISFTGLGLIVWIIARHKHL
jgi:hypothetical protein